MVDGAEKRRNNRFPAEVAMRYDFAYDVETKLKIQVKKEFIPQKLIPKYPAISKNVSLEGIGFVASKLLSEGDFLNLELYLPHEKDPIHMEGKVRWSKPVQPEKPNSKLCYETGVQLITIEGKEVEETIYFDEQYKILWSKVLDNILGGYHLSALKSKESDMKKN
ncbi:MAG TPA: PilZ domain-containing protein [Candidatus Omnitrophota bacterium]|nr:PilZ domain-containing protein [Candidatus Omnitrophota bacterium]HPN88518.1 PilZ domain-containing protein [Candidatus Omnitrophota bacterium]